jgi:hypothetical protein
MDCRIHELAAQGRPTNSYDLEVDQERPYQTYPEGERQHGCAGKSTNITVVRRVLCEVQFGHDVLPLSDAMILPDLRERIV